MPESGRDPRDHFIIQRRNLILCSLIAVFHSLFKSEENQLTLLSGLIDFGKHPPVKAVLLFALLYLLIRYSQAIHQLSKETPVLKNFFDYNNKRLQRESYSFIYIDNDGNKTSSPAIGTYTIRKNPPIEQGIDVLKENPKTGELERVALLEDIAVLTYIRVSSICTWLFLCIKDITFFEYLFPFVLFVVGALALFGYEFVPQLLQGIDDLISNSSNQ